MTNRERDESAVELNVAEYVLGTLEPFEARRVERSLDNDDTEVQRRLAYWERRLGALGLALKPVEPPPSVWQSISGRLNESPSLHAASDAPIKTPAHATTGSLALWRGWAIAASAAAVVLAAVLLLGPTGGRTENSGAAFAAVLHDAPTGTNWMVTAQPANHRILVQAMSDYPVPKNKTLRAWVKTADGRSVPVGKFPNTRGAHTLVVSQDAEESLGDAAEFMVTMENVDQDNDWKRHGRIMWVSSVVRNTG